MFLMPGLSPSVNLSSGLASQIFDLKSIVNQFELEPGMRIADLGSGSGYFTVEMARVVGEVGQVMAVDILDTALETVRERASGAGIKNVQLVKANLEVIGSTFLADDSQDFVLLANVLFQNDQKLEIIKEAKRILRPVGKLVIVDWEKGVGGLGPPDEFRTPKESILGLASQEGLNYERDIIVDAYHFGMMFRK
ncbi:MAG: methyltransferase domain-containing protein [Patescibacteria group bacterium]